MKRRKTVIEKFSTFLDVQEDSTGSRQLITRWQLIPSLENNMRLQIESCPDAGIPFWQRSWLGEARRDNSDPLAARHLHASLQEGCFWAAQKIYNLLPTQDMGLRDYIQIAQSKATDPVALLKRYDNSRGRSLESYGQFQLERSILDTVRKGNEMAGYSDWGLLRALSKKGLKVALKKAWLTELQLSCCLLAWQCFNEIYTPLRVNRQLQEPQPEEYAAFAELYNQLRFPQSQSPALSGDDIKTLLQTCILAARASIAIPTLISGDVQDYLEADPEHRNNEHLRPPTPDTSPSQAEQEQEQGQQVRAVLNLALAELPESDQTMLQLWHGLGLNQQDIGRAMSLKQYQVSRQLQRDKRLVLQALAQWSKTQTGIALSPKKIEELSQPLNQWLDWYCQTPFHEFLQTTLLKELWDKIPLLQRYYGQELDQVEVASELNLDATDVNLSLEQVKQHLQSRLHSWVEDRLNLSPGTLNSAAKRIAALVEEWLTNAKYSTLEI